MKTAACAAVLAMAAVAQAELLSQATFTLVPDGPDVPTWSFTVGVTYQGETSWGFDLGVDAEEPPWSPGPEVRLHTLGVPGALDGLTLDYRDWRPWIDLSPYGWNLYDLPFCHVAWGLGAVDSAYPDVLRIEGRNLGYTGYTTGTLTWDLSAAHPGKYYLYDVEAGNGIEVLPGGSYDWMVMNRFGTGPTLVIAAIVWPEPGTALLLGSGLLVLGGLARRKS